jgi:LysM repeat protein
MRRFFPFLLVISLFWPTIMALPIKTYAQAGDAWQLISEVNGLRAAYGLPAYKTNNALMAAAQGHSDYQAQIGTWTHTGAGGSRPHDRAVAAGYGGGAQVYVSENVATGVNLSTSRAVNEMWQDAIHLETMISSSYTDIGAGVGLAGDWVYYTIVVGYIAGSPGSGTNPGDSPPPSNELGTPAPTTIPIQPISIATPEDDGSITHVVQYGQFLENIANAYEIALNDLLTLNGLSEQAIIYPGDKLLVKAGATPEFNPDLAVTETVEETEPTTPEAQATSTAKKETKTPTPVSVAMNSQLPTAATMMPISETVTLMQQEQHNYDFLLYAVFGLALAGTAFILLGTALKKRP